jgi:hypothetical protein
LAKRGCAFYIYDSTGKLYNSGSYTNAFDKPVVEVNPFASKGRCQTVGLLTVGDDQTTLTRLVNNPRAGRETRSQLFPLSRGAFPNRTIASARRSTAAAIAQSASASEPVAGTPTPPRRWAGEPLAVVDRGGGDGW